MKTAVLAPDARRRVRAGGPGRGRAAGSAYVALTKPRIAVMVLVTVAAGFLLGRSRGRLAPVDASC